MAAFSYCEIATTNGLLSHAVVLWSTRAQCSNHRNHWLDIGFLDRQEQVRLTRVSQLPTTIVKWLLRCLSYFVWLRIVTGAEARLRMRTSLTDNLTEVTSTAVAHLSHLERHGI
jgi:hypothetical protein